VAIRDALVSDERKEPSVANDNFGKKSGEQGQSKPGQGGQQAPGKNDPNRPGGQEKQGQGQEKGQGQGGQKKPENEPKGGNR
jgi:hypothetical protein